MTLPVSKETFFDAIDRGDTAALERYLAEGYKLGERNNAGNTELGYSLICRQPAVADFLIEKSGTLDLRCREQATALQYAVVFGYEDVAAKMIDRGASFGSEMKDKWGTYPLDVIERNDMKECLLAVWRRYAPKEKETMLLSAIARADVERLALLVERGGADIVTCRGKIDAHLRTFEEAGMTTAATPYDKVRAYVAACWKKADIAEYIASGPVRTATALPRKPPIRF